MWGSFRKKYKCTAEIISFSIGLVVGFYLWFIHPVLGVFVGGAIAWSLRGKEIIIWPKSIEQKAKEGSIPRNRE